MNLNAITLAITRPGAVRSWDPLAMFTTGVAGAWYDPSDTTTLYRDAAGTLPVTAVEQPVGLMLDKSKGLVLGPELVTNGTFDSGTTNWTAVGATQAVVGGEFEITVTASGWRSFQEFTTVVGRAYVVTGSVRPASGNSVAQSGRVTIASPSYSVAADANGATKQVRFVFVATSTTSRVELGVASGGAVGATGDKAFFDNISVRELPGNHAFNSSGNSANFPVLSARYNLLTKTEDFSDVVWKKDNVTVAINATIAPDGTLTAAKIVESSATSTHRIYQEINPGTSTASFYAKASGRNWVRLNFNGSGAVNFDLANGVVGSTVSGITAKIVNVGNGWYQCFASGSFGITLVNYIIDLEISDGGTGTTAQSYQGDGTSGVYIWGADLRVANDALNQPAYQRVNTATDYDTVGFKPAEVFDGVDDNLIASAGGGSTTAFFWCSAIRVGKVGAVQTLFSDAGTNTGYRVRINASNQLELSAGNGTAYTTVATTATLSIGQRAVLTAWHDGTNLNVQINNGTVHQAAFVTATAGTAQFTIGKDNNAASNFFAGRLYEKIYTKDNVPSAAQITSTKTYVANVAGITLS